MRRLLIITHDFPPALAGVRRMVKFAKYLPEFGYTPVVLCATPDPWQKLDMDGLVEVERLGIEVLRTGSLDPYRAAGGVRSAGDFARSLVPNRLRRRPAAASADAAGLMEAIALKKKPSARGEWRLTRWARQAGTTATRFALVPDDRVGWVPFAVENARRLLRNRRFDALLTSSWPNSAHLVGLRLSKDFRIPWVADFRDGWTQNPYFGKGPTPLHEAINRRLEQRVARGAGALTTVSAPIAEHLDRVAGRQVTTVIPNGYDPDDTAGLEPMKFDKFTVAYTGTLFMQRSPELFFAALRALLDDRPNLAEFFQVVFMTKFKPEHEAMIREQRLGDVVVNLGLGSYAESLRLQRGADALLALEGEAANAEIMLTQKVFEYLHAGKPILAVAPQGALATTVWRSGAGVVVAPDNVYAIKERLVELFHGQLPFHPDEAFIAGFHRRRLTGELATVLDRVSAGARGV